MRGIATTFQGYGTIITDESKETNVKQQRKRYGKLTVGGVS